MKGIINFFNIILFPFAIIIGFTMSFKCMWLIIALYSSMMLVNIIINSIINAVINRKYEADYDAFWRVLYIIITAISWSFYF